MKIVLQFDSVFLKFERTQKIWFIQKCKPYLFKALTCLSNYSESF